MKALVLDERGLRLIDDHPEPTLPDGYVRVRTTLAGVCNTDLEIVRGYMGFRGVLGHELLGVVEGGAFAGRRVVAEINFACGTCAFCKDGVGRHCPTRGVMGILGRDGAFAQRVAVPVDNLHMVPDEVSDERAVFVEPLAAAFEIREQLDVAVGRRSLVLGDGKLGLLVAMVLNDAGADVLLVGRHEGHLSIAAEAGIATSLDSAWDREPRDLVVDATGNADGFATAIAATRPRGTLVLKSTVADQTQAMLATIVINEITVVGSRCGPFAPALAALQSGAIDPTPMIDSIHPLDDALVAFDAAKKRGSLKVLIRP